MTDAPPSFSGLIASIRNQFGPEKYDAMMRQAELRELERRSHRVGSQSNRGPTRKKGGSNKKSRSKEVPSLSLEARLRPLLIELQTDGQTKTDATRLVRKVWDIQFPRAPAKRKKNGLIPPAVLERLAVLRREREAQLLGCSVDELQEARSRERTRLKKADWIEIIRECYPSGQDDWCRVRDQVYAFERPPRPSRRPSSKARKVKKPQQKD